MIIKSKHSFHNISKTQAFYYSISAMSGAFFIVLKSYSEKEEAIYFNTELELREEISKLKNDGFVIIEDSNMGFNYHESFFLNIKELKDNTCEVNYLGLGTLIIKSLLKDITSLIPKNQNIAIINETNHSCFIFPKYCPFFFTGNTNKSPFDIALFFYPINSKEHIVFNLYSDNQLRSVLKECTKNNLLILSVPEEDGNIFSFNYHDEINIYMREQSDNTLEFMYNNKTTINLNVTPEFIINQISIKNALVKF